MKLESPDRAVHIAWAVRMPQETPEERLAALRDRALPVWRDLAREGRLAERFVYEETDVLRAEPGLPAWNQLHLARPAPGVDAGQLMGEERDRLVQAGFDGTILRAEVLVSSPQSYYPGPPAAAYSIEYIRVDAPFLDEYRESMRVNSGPTMQAVIAEGAAASFAALETTSVVHTSEDACNWNQIHVVGLAAPDPAKFLPAFVRCLGQVNPDSGGFERVFGRLGEIRTHAKTVWAREVPELRIVGTTHA